MKQKYQKPEVEVIKLQVDRTVLNATSPDPIPGGGGTPDAPEFFDLINNDPLPIPGSILQN